MICENCGKEARPGDVFCRSCGAALGEGKAPAAGAAEERARAEAAEPAAPLPVPPVTPPSYVSPPTPGAYAKGTSGWAIASLVLGILSFLCFPFIGAALAIVFGIISKSGIKSSGGELGGSGLATAGIVLGAVNLAILVIFAAIIIPWTIINIGETRTVTRTVTAQGAKSVTANIDMNSGKLNVEGGAKTMFEGEFTYNVKKWEPEIEYSVSNNQGELDIERGSDWWLFDLWFVRNDWDLAFDNDMPLELIAQLSSADSNFDLQTLSLLSLDVDSSSGDVNADLSGDLPDLKRVSIDVSSGDVYLDMRGAYETYLQMDVESSSGDIAVNLLGRWEAALNASISASSGGVTLHLPGDVGVRVNASARSGDINAPGMKRESGDDDSALYVNDAFRDSTVTLQINVETSSGDITLLVDE